MEREFVSYEQAVALKELGFDEECLKYYLQENDKWVVSDDYDGGHFVTAPLKQQVFRWFREKYGLLGYVDSDTQEYGIEYSYHVNILKEGDTWFKLYIDTYEKAENGCIEELITLAKKQDNEQ